MANLPLLTTVPPVVQFNHVHNVAHDSDIPRECLMYQYPPDDKHDEYVDDEHDRIEYEHFLARLYIQRVRAMGLA